MAKKGAGTDGIPKVCFAFFFEFSVYNCIRSGCDCKHMYFQAWIDGPKRV